VFDGPILNLGGLRGAIIGDNYPSYYKQLPWPYVGDQPIWDRWNFAYRQCTSFVAWRLNSANGVPFSNQYLGVGRWGDAGQWADSARSVGIKVDKHPEVGAVAWSGPGYRGASGFGHVAWVAQILGNGKIVIEEYNYGWGGGYHYRVIDPREFEGYIHIKDLESSFANVTVPVIAGVPAVGAKLTAAVTGWEPAPTSFRYQWKRDGEAIRGATGKTYQLTPSDRGSVLSVEVTGGRAGYRAEGMSSADTGKVLLADKNGNGIEDALEVPERQADDVAASRYSGVWVATSDGGSFVPAVSVREDDQPAREAKPLTDEVFAGSVVRLMR
jgi:surface antigen